MGKRSGGIAKEGSRDKAFSDNDVYFHPNVADILLENLKPHFENFSNPFILDACANDGVLGKSVIKTIGNGNLTLQDMKIDGESILNYRPERLFDIIVSNPPWIPVELPEAIFHHLLTLLSDNGILIFVINLPFFYQGWKRAFNLRFQKFYFLPRYIFAWQNRPLLDVGVSVTHKDGIVPEKAMKKDCFIYIPKEICKYENSFFDMNGKSNPQFCEELQCCQ